MRRVTYLLTVLLAITSRSAFAIPVRVDFAGTVSGFTTEDTSGQGLQISQAQAEAALGGSIQIGSSFSGYVVYDDADVESDGQSESQYLPTQKPVPNWSLYYFPSPYYPDGQFHSPPLGPNAESHGTVGSFVGQPGGLLMELFDNEIYLQNASPSVVMLEAGLGGTIPGTSAAAGGFILRAIGGGPGAPLHSTSLVGIPWSIANFPASTIDFSFHDSVNNFNIDVLGTVTSLVPEPETLAFFALAAFLLLAARQVRCSERSDSTI